MSVNDLQSLANHLQARGRGQDSVLVHMTPAEVGGLQALAVAHGGSLTTHPETGLPEAGFLSSLLPTVLGIAGTVLSGGALSPLMMAGAVGLGETALSGGNLSKGLMAGLGAFGGAGLGAGLSALGAGAAGAAGTAATTAAASPFADAATGAVAADTSNPFAAAALGTTTAAPTAALNAVSLGDIPPGTSPFALGAQGFTGAEAVPTASLNAMGLGTGGVQAVAPVATPPGMLAQFAAAHPQLAQFGQGFANATNLGLPGMLGNAGTALGIAGLTSPLSQAEALNMPSNKNNWVYQGPYQMAPRTVQFPTNRASGDTSEFQYFTPSNPGVLTAAGTTPTPWSNNQYAGGGPVALKDGAFVVDARTVSELGNGSSGAGQDLLAQHGGQPIQGTGDGVSDSVPANINGQQPARVARDEVKFDPHAVRKLGGGDARRGAQRLYALMDQARQARMMAGRGQDTGLQSLLPR